MKLLRVLRRSGAVLLVTSLVVLAGCQKPSTPPPPAPAAVVDPGEPTEAQPKLKTVKLWLGAEQMDAELCITPQEVRTGMMFRKTMGTNDGMIFSLGVDQQASFWMKNCFVPLSVAYIDSQGTIEEIHPLQVQDETPVVSATNNIRFALETPQGWFEQHHVNPGMVVRSERGTLLETFGQRN